MRRSHLVALFPCVALLACATTTTPNEPAGPPPVWKLASASMATGSAIKGKANGGNGGPISETIQGRSINGARISLSVSGGHLSGMGNREEAIDISITADKAEGLVGFTPFSASIIADPAGGAHVTGTMANGKSDFIITPQVINGLIGGVTYSLNWNPDKQQYEGNMMPGGYAFLMLPAVMATWSDAEAVTVIALLMIGT